MAKTNATVTSDVQTTAATTASRISAFKDNQHKGHKLVHVGGFIQSGESVGHDVWYCVDDHALIVA